jgi:hypothetical protein
MTIQEALTHPNVIELVRNKPKDVRVLAVMDSGNAVEIY